MFAKLMQADIDPGRLDSAARAVSTELIPRFVAHPGARQGYWMANRDSGRVLAMTGWDDAETLLAEQRSDGTERTVVAEHIGLRIWAVRAMRILAAHEPGAAGARAHWVRATWVEGVPADRLGDLPAMHAAVVPDQSMSEGFCGSYWLADHETGDGLALSLWDSGEHLRSGEPDSRRRRRSIEHQLGCTVTAVDEYESLGVVVDPADGGVSFAQPA